MESRKRPGFGSGLLVWVLGRPDRSLVDALWSVGLRPVRGQRTGCVWAQPGEGDR